MGDNNQSQGRNDNDAIPPSQWQSQGVSGGETSKEAGANATKPTEQPYGQDEQAERTGRTAEVTGEARTFESPEPGAQPIPAPNDFEGPAGDPAEGKRSGSDESWPA
jgi:hypothetical protein